MLKAQDLINDHKLFRICSAAVVWLNVYLEDKTCDKNNEESFLKYANILRSYMGTEVLNRFIHYSVVSKIYYISSLIRYAYDGKAPIKLEIEAQERLDDIEKAGYLLDKKVQRCATCHKLVLADYALMSEERVYCNEACLAEARNNQEQNMRIS